MEAPGAQDMQRLLDRFTDLRMKLPGPHNRLRLA